MCLSSTIPIFGLESNSCSRKVGFWPRINIFCFIFLALNIAFLILTLVSVSLVRASGSIPIELSGIHSFPFERTRIETESENVNPPPCLADM